MKRYGTMLTAALSFAALVIVGCQEVEQPSPMLTQEQMKKVNEHIFDYAHDEQAPKDMETEPKQAPEPEYKIGANYQNKIEFLGFSVGDPKDDDPLVPGKTTTFRWYWKALDDMDENWQIFVHFDSKDTNVKPAKRRQNLDHQPMDGLYPTSKWPKGKIIEDVQEVKIRDDYPEGPAVPYVGFFRGKSRLAIENDVRKTNDRRVKAPSLTVKGGSGSTSGESPETQYDVAEHADEAAQQYEVDGKLDEAFWEETEPLELSPFGSEKGKKTTVRVARLGDTLAVGAHLEDEHVWSTKKERDSATWEEEVFEMFVDPNGDGNDYLELQINPLGTIFDANFEKRLGTGKGSRSDQIDRAKKFDLEGLESAVHVEGTANNEEDEDEFWSIELKIPFESIPGIESADELGEKWAVNFYRFDRPSKDQTLSYAWETAPRGDFHQVSKFGSLRFAGEESDNGDDEKKKIPKNLRDKLKKKNIPKLRGGPGPIPKLKKKQPPGSTN